MSATMTMAPAERPIDAPGSTDEAIDAPAAMDGAARDIRLLAEHLDRADLADRIEEIRRRAARTETVVCVVGEFKNGKSALINALLGRVACPVDDDLATSAVTVVRYGDPASAEVHRRDGDERVVESIDPGRDRGMGAGGPGSGTAERRRARRGPAAGTGARQRPDARGHAGRRRTQRRSCRGDIGVPAVRRCAGVRDRRIRRVVRRRARIPGQCPDRRTARARGAHQDRHVSGLAPHPRARRRPSRRDRAHGTALRAQLGAQDANRRGRRRERLRRLRRGAAWRCRRASPDGHAWSRPRASCAGCSASCASR